MVEGIPLLLLLFSKLILIFSEIIRDNGLIENTDTILKNMKKANSLKNEDAKLQGLTCIHYVSQLPIISVKLRQIGMDWSFFC
jgi:hypothetical protein